MTQKYAVLPCNGLDKPVGPLAREVALALVAASGSELICPVLLGRASARYKKVLAELPLFAIDGCATRCASRLATARGLKIDRKFQVAEAAKAAAKSVVESLTPGPLALAFCHSLAAEMLAEPVAAPEPASAADFSQTVRYASFTHDKFIFRVPQEGYYFDENDCWARVSGSRARVGISDFMQQRLSDVVFCNQPAVGTRIEQFGEAGTVESTKAVFEVVSPVGGKVVAVNGELLGSPELINDDPYKRGWIAELELADFAADRELLLDGAQYLELLKQKTAEFKG